MNNLDKSYLFMDGDSGEHGILDCRMTVEAPGIPGPHWSSMVFFAPYHITEHLSNSNTPKLDGL